MNKVLNKLVMYMGVMWSLGFMTGAVVTAWLVVGGRV